MKKYLTLCLVCCLGVLASWAQVPPIGHIEANNVNGTILGNGTMFLNYFDNNDINPCPTWEVPAGSGKSTIFQHALWIGGLDADDSLHLAAMRYGNGFNWYFTGGQDFWSGPLKLIDGSLDLMTALQYHRVWSLTSEEIEFFRQNVGSPNYVIPVDILSWPAHGNQEYANNMAPFVDVNGDGRYVPADGDYPDIKGDHCLFFIFNDAYGAHSETGGTPLGIEIHAMVYAFDAPNDETLNNTVFTHYKFINRSRNDYHDTYLGLWSDWDLGYALDDYVGCDVQRNACFVYNGREIDGNGEINAYGDNCPVQATVVLAGPTVGDKRLGMTGFVYHNNDNTAAGDPNDAPDYYLLMKGCWKDGSPIEYGGGGYPGAPGVVGPRCRYMFPGDSDPENIGTDGIQPNGGYNLPGRYWTEEESGNEPYDRRGLASVGPFDLPAGGTQELDYALVTIWKNNSLSAMERKGEFIDHIKAFFENGLSK